MPKAKKKKQSFFVYNKSVKTSVLAVLLVVTIPALYIVLFVIKADKEIREMNTTIRGYLDKETCEIESKRDCYEVSTVYEEQYYVPAQ